MRPAPPGHYAYAGYPAGSWTEKCCVSHDSLTPSRTFAPRTGPLLLRGLLRAQPAHPGLHRLRPRLRVAHLRPEGELPQRAPPVPCPRSKEVPLLSTHRESLVTPLEAESARWRAPCLPLQRAVFIRYGFQALPVIQDFQWPGLQSQAWRTVFWRLERQPL
jgi:hypothetical protein